jgi:phospholipid-translocating ATPase
LLGKILYPLLLPIDAGYNLQAIVVFVISIHAYAYEKSETEEVSMVALSGCIWLQAFVLILETK